MVLVTVKLKPYSAAALAGIITVIGLETKLAFDIGAKLGIAIELPPEAAVAKEYLLGLPVVAV